MIILASSNNKVITRWNGAVDKPTDMIVINHVEKLPDCVKQFPDPVTVVHYSLNGLGGVKGIKQLHETVPVRKMLVLEDIPSELHGVELLKSGILGYGNTYLDPSVLQEAIKVIQIGEIWVSKRLVQWLANNCNPLEPYPAQNGKEIQLNSLTASEVKILTQLLDGDSNKVIAKKLNISERTVKAHLTSIFRKTGVKDRLHLVLSVSGRGNS